MDRVSIIIPCYNAGDHLVEAVESALAQSHDDIEVVIVDDGSTDKRTIELLETPRWPNTRVIRQANGGPAAARNKAISAATGDYILPLDADDRIGPGYAAEALRVLKERPEVGVVYCRAEKFGAENGPWLLPAYNLRELVIDNVVFVTAMYRKEDWARVGGYNEGLRHGVEDYDFWIKMVSLGREVTQLESCHFFYRVQRQSRTTGFSQDRGAMVKTYADIVRSNAPFFLKNMEFIFEHRFGLYDELARYRSRYADLEPFLARLPALRVCFELGIRHLVKALRLAQRVKARLKWFPRFLSPSGKLHDVGSREKLHRQEFADRATAIPIDPGSLGDAEWSRTACDLATRNGRVIVHKSGTVTIFDGYVIGPGKRPVRRFDIVLKSGSAAYKLATTTGVSRADVAEYFEDQALISAGFRIESDLAGVDAGTYAIEYHMDFEGKHYFSEPGKEITVL